jgi:hypothetical protein
MRKFAGALAALAILVASGLFAIPTQAATLNVATDSLFFGNQVVGTTSAPVLLTITVTLGAGEVPVDWVVDGVAPSSVSFSRSPQGDCSILGGTCTVAYVFHPASLGIATATQTTFFLFDDSSCCLQSTPLVVSLNGVGIAPVPLPAALPLFGSALAAMGIFRWWRRRRLVAA